MSGDIWSGLVSMHNPRALQTILFATNNLSILIPFSVGVEVPRFPRSTLLRIIKNAYRTTLDCLFCTHVCDHCGQFWCARALTMGVIVQEDQGLYRILDHFAIGGRRRLRNSRRVYSSRICAGTVEFAVVTGVIAVVNPLSSETGNVEKARWPS